MKEGKGVKGTPGRHWRKEGRKEGREDFRGEMDGIEGVEGRTEGRN